MKSGKFKINIFGVGRSGTKALQLYLAYIFAKNEGKVHLNYEPYNFITRRGPLNYEGLFLNYNSNLFINSKNELSRNHIRFINRIARHNNLSLITKFVHANGRISAINEVMKPDLTIIIIRDLFETLNSLARMKWDYLSFGYFLLRNTYINIWEKLLAEAKKNNIIENINEIENKVNDIYHMNAFYWYCMNISALNYKGDNVVFINYKDFKYLPKMLSVYIPYELDENINDKKFVGSNVHRQYPLIDIKNNNSADIWTKIKIKLNEFNFYLFRNRKSPLFNFPIGTRVIINNNKLEPENYEEKSHIRVEVEKTDIIKNWNYHIMDKLEQVKLKF